MKTLSQVKEQVATENGYKEWKEVLNDSPIRHIEMLMDEVARRYAADQLTALGNDLLSDIRSNLN